MNNYFIKELEMDIQKHGRIYLTIKNSDGCDKVTTKDIIKINDYLIKYKTDDEIKCVPIENIKYYNI